MKPKLPTAASCVPIEVRSLRVIIALVLVAAALHTLEKLLDKEILESNKLEVGLLLGWLIAKSGTVIDWLFGGSESGARRTDAALRQSVAGPKEVKVTNTPSDPVPVTEPEPEMVWPPEKDQ